MPSKPEAFARDVSLNLKGWQLGIILLALDRYINRVEKPRRGERPSETAMRVGRLRTLQGDVERACCEICLDIGREEQGL